jgi:hypothetical protein
LSPEEPPGSSSGGDDPPLRRPRQAGFVAWPLTVALVALFVCSPKYQGFGWSRTASHRVEDSAGVGQERACGIIAKFTGSLPIGDHIGVPNTSVYEQDMTLFSLERLIPSFGDFLKYHREASVGQKIRLRNPPTAACRRYSFRILARYRKHRITVSSLSVPDHHRFSEVYAALREAMLPVGGILGGTAKVDGGSFASVGPVKFDCGGIFLRLIRRNYPRTIGCNFSIGASPCLNRGIGHLSNLLVGEVSIHSGHEYGQASDNRRSFLPADLELPVSLLFGAMLIVVGEWTCWRAWDFDSDSAAFALVFAGWIVLDGGHLLILVTLGVS